MAIDFPASPALNDTFTSGGVTYAWDGTVWVASGSAAFVLKAGDTFTGNVEIGTGIDLNTNGSAEFKSSVKALNFDVRQADGSAGGVALGSGEWHTGSAAANNEGVIAYNSPLHFYSPTTTTDGLILGTDGSGTFDGSVNSVSAALAVGGYRHAQTDAGYYLQDDAGNSSIALYKDGSATFAGTVTSNGQIIGDRNLDDTSNAASIVVANNQNSTAIRLNNDGGASFASGTVNVSLSGGDGRLNVLRTDAGKAFAVNSSTSSTETISFLGDGTATFAGNITAGNVSDIKFKENITVAGPQLSDVVALGNSLKNWDWKEEAPLNDELKAKRFLGLIAQEAEEICPGLVYEVGEGEDSYKAINHDILVMKLLGAVAELKAEVEALKGELGA